MFEAAIQILWPYGAGAAAILFAAYWVWSDVREGNAQARRVMGRLTELFQIESEEEVLKNLRKPDGGTTGSIKLDGDILVALVLEGPEGLFVHSGGRGEDYISVPWRQIDRVDQVNKKHIAIYAKQRDDESIEILLPWSPKMSLDGWIRYKESNA